MGGVAAHSLPALRVCRPSVPCLWTQERGVWSWGRGYIFWLSLDLGSNWPKCRCYSVLLPKSGLWALLGITVWSFSLGADESLAKLFSNTCVCWSGVRGWGSGGDSVQTDQEASEADSHPGQVSEKPALPASFSTLVLAIGGHLMCKLFYA